MLFDLNGFMTHRSCFFCSAFCLLPPPPPPPLSRPTSNSKCESAPQPPPAFHPNHPSTPPPNTMQSAPPHCILLPLLICVGVLLCAVPASANPLPSLAAIGFPPCPEQCSSGKVAAPLSAAGASSCFVFRTI